MKIGIWTKIWEKKARPRLNGSGISLASSPHGVLGNELCVEDSAQLDARARMRETLQREHGVVFHQKDREVDVPIVDHAYLSKFVLPEDMEDMVEWVSYLTDYLDGQAIFDSWGMDDEKRVAWRKKMMDQYGQVFIDVYTRPNQLTRASMSSVSGGLYGVAQCIERIEGHMLMAKYFFADSAKLREVLHGYHLVPIQDRLEVVRLHEDVALDTLKRIFSTANKRQMMLT